MNCQNYLFYNILFACFYFLSCNLDWKHNAGDPFTKEYWRTRFLEEWFVAYPRIFVIQGRVSGLYQNSLKLVSSSDGTSVSISANGSFSMTVFASPKYFDIQISSQPDNLHCIVWDRGVWDGTNQTNMLITCPFAKTVVLGKTLLWDRCTFGSSWNPEGNGTGIGNGDCSIGTATALNYCTTGEGYNATTNPNACNGGNNSFLVDKGPIFSACLNSRNSKRYGQSNWRLPLYTEMFSIIRCSATNTGVITGEDGCLTVGDATKYPGATADPILFPGTIADNYWSSQTFPAGGDIQAYMINFNPGNESYLNKDQFAYVRCVSE
ncbi:Lcl C-terminal domain-containing protein [Leptospira limi]|uniref:DUF1566 domain-containing protein n=1 Tax=Leptospira limi TaxID=2950023 RepID=A0ABT3LYE0_9LEPT|nr:DUF1566 domain-containing protein [Leptospira limi]MCW7462500.1 DUF1566 domain-containing protein [Leptospira limi]